HTPPRLRISALFPYTTLFRSIEMNISIVCACLPALKPLVSLVAPSIFGTTASGSQPPSHRDYRNAYGSKKISSGGSGVRGFSDKDRKSTRLNSSHVKISYAVF